MYIRVLGSAAGGGFPQWNCCGPVSLAAWRGSPTAARGTQSSLAVSADGRRWVLVNASPDIRQQILASDFLHPRPRDGLRSSPIKAVVLTNADVDHVAGLLSLRERQAFSIYASARVLDVLAENSIFGVLDPSVVDRLPMSLDRPVRLADHGSDLGLTIEAFAVPGKVALYLERADAADFGSQAGDTIGLKVGTADGRSFFYVPACARVDEALLARLDGAGLVLFDGTLYRDDEMIRQGLLDKTGRRMGHISIGGDEGSMAALARANIERRVFIHINTSNPVLDTGSAEHRAVREAGWEIAYDGMELDLR